MRPVKQLDTVDENVYSTLTVKESVPVKRGRGQRRNRRTRNTVRVEAGWTEVQLKGPLPEGDSRFPFTLTLF